MKPTHLDLFSGIGGFALAAEWAGFETIGFSEIDPYASQVLKKHWPAVPNYGDVRTIGTVQCDLITGGFPCQPHSFAGKRRGAKDERHLWPAMRDVIGRCKPSWVCGENVPGIIGLELNKVLSDLESLGYRVQPLVIPACAVDAPHRRDRVWIVAHSRSQRDNGRSSQRAGQESAGAHGESVGSGEHAQHVANSKGERRGEGWTKSVPQGQTGSSGNGSLANPGVAGLEGREEQHAREECATAQRGGDAVSDTQCGQQELRGSSGRVGRIGQSISRNDGRIWSTEPDVGRVAHGIPNRVDRLRGLGNAIVPQVAQVILQAIHQALTGNVPQA